MTDKNSIIQALEIIKGKKIYDVDFENGTFECGASVFGFELTKSGLIRSNSVNFLRPITKFKTAHKNVTQDLQPVLELHDGTELPVIEDMTPQPSHDHYSLTVPKIATVTIGKQKVKTRGR